MKKDAILSMRKAYKINEISLYLAFNLACEEAYKLRSIPVSPQAQHQLRASAAAFPLTAMYLDFMELFDKLKATTETN